MIKKCMFLIGFLITSHLIANESECANKMSQNSNRYQMQVVTAGESHHISEIYLLDREKGIIWKTRDRSSWKGEVTSYDPWIQLPPLPD